MHKQENLTFRQKATETLISFSKSLAVHSSYYLSQLFIISVSLAAAAFLIRLGVQSPSEPLGWISTLGGVPVYFALRKLRDATFKHIGIDIDHIQPENVAKQRVVENRKLRITNPYPRPLLTLPPDIYQHHFAREEMMAPSFKRAPLKTLSELSLYLDPDPAPDPEPCLIDLNQPRQSRSSQMSNRRPALKRELDELLEEQARLGPPKKTRRRPKPRTNKPS